MSKFLWCEDSKSGYQFLKFILGELCPDVVVESKNNNTGLRKATSKIAVDGNLYYIVMDKVQDNPDVLRETKRLVAEAAGKENIHLLWLHSFEFVLLSFELLEKWVFAENDELKEKRESLFQLRDLFIQLISSGGDAERLKAFKEEFCEYERKNAEQIAAKLLYEITRNTGFETNKAKIGDCFINNCCEWVNRQSDDLCGLDSHRISSDEKARLLVEHSVLKEAFEGVGLQ